jgi:cytidine deaminase
MDEVDDLLELAREQRDKAYSPYSGFSVGAVVETSDGNLYGGMNIENINYSDTLHAEETAIAEAVKEGYREPEDYERMAISVSGESAPPCGNCRQVMAEFCGPDFEIIVDEGGEYTLGELLPASMDNID